MSELVNIEESLKENFEVYQKAKLDVFSIQETVCQFFLRTSACRYGGLCKKQHISPTASCTIVCKNMFQEKTLPKYSKAIFLNAFRKQSIIDLEGENEDLHNDRNFTQNLSEFHKFYMDVYPEFKKFGLVKSILVSNNKSPHLRGNVYVTYQSIQNSIDCFEKMNGRFYAGLPVCVGFSFIENCKDAKCTYQFRCPRDAGCNFLHLYVNPKSSHGKRSRSPRGKLSH